MSPIKDRDQFARENARDLFPSLNETKIAEVADYFARNFQSGYSPNSNDWEIGERGIGSGATAREYVAYMGHALSDLEPDPNKMSSEQFWKAIHKCITM